MIKTLISIKGEEPIWFLTQDLRTSTLIANIISEKKRVIAVSRVTIPQ